MSQPISLSDIEAEATTAAVSFLESAESWIDGQFGAGYAEKHPAMVAGYMQACAMVYQAQRIGRSMDDLAAGLRASADAVATRLDSLDDAVDALCDEARRDHGG